MIREIYNSTEEFGGKSVFIFEETYFFEEKVKEETGSTLLRYRVRLRDEDLVHQIYFKDMIVEQLKEFRCKRYSNLSEKNGLCISFELPKEKEQVYLYLFKKCFDEFINLIPNR